MPPKMRKVLLCLGILALTAGLVWAASELAGQANKSAAAAGSDAADMDMASLDMIKPSTKTTIDWKQERALKKKIDEADAAYRVQLGKAGSDISGSGKVAPATRDAGLKAAAAFKSASDNYAAFWDKNNGKTRAKLAREVGQSRVKSAEMAFNDVSSDKIDAYNAQQQQVRTAQKAYVADAKQDVSAKDRAEIKSSVGSRLKKTLASLQNLMQTITGLVSQVQSQASSVASNPVGAMTGFAKNAITGGASSDGPASLLSPLQSLLSLVKSMFSNVQGMMADVNSL